MLDWSRISALQNEIGAEDFEEVVPLFLMEVEETLESLHGCSEPSALEEKMHFLKGSAMNIGFDAFSALCHSGERAAAAGNGAAIDVDEICDCFAQSKAAFETGLKQGKAA